MPTYVQHGGADLGVVGLDTLIEHGGEGLYRPLDLGVARCRMSVAAPLDFDYAAAARQGSRIRVATKFTRIARDHFADKGVHVDMIKLYGSMELAPLTGLADAIVDLVASGNTLKANALVEVEEIMQISARLVVNKAALKLDREPIRALDRFARGGGRGGSDAMSLAMRTLDSSAPGFDAALTALLAYSAETDGAIEASVAAILADVRARGDAAVLEYTRRFDGIDAASMAELEVGAGRAARRARRAAVGAARARSKPPPRAIRDFHERQLEACGRSWSYRDGDGSLLGQKVTPIERVGIYVPGGKAAYPSSVLMNAIPAQGRGRRRDRHGRADAGRRAQPARPRRRRARRRRPACSRSAARRRSARSPTARRRFRRSHKITGPGNAYVASAKRRVFGTVGIDMIAGPSEILVLADGTTPPDWVAMDLFSQAEHDALAQSILLCPDAGYLDRVARRDRAAAAGAAAPRHHPRVARRPRRARPDALDGRGVRDQQPDRARAPRGERARARSAGSRC